MKYEINLETVRRLKVVLSEDTLLPFQMQGFAVVANHIFIKGELDFSVNSFVIYLN